MSYIVGQLPFARYAATFTDAEAGAVNAAPGIEFTPEESEAAFAPRGNNAPPSLAATDGMSKGKMLLAGLALTGLASWALLR